MCKYIDKPYKTHFACIKHRLTFKRDRYTTPLCPTCRVPMVNMGMDFAAPPKRDLAEWERLGRLVARYGERIFQGCGCPRSKTFYSDHMLWEFR